MAKGFVPFSTSAIKHYRSPRTLGEAYGHGVQWTIEPMGSRRRHFINRWTVVCSLALASVVLLAANCAWSVL